MGGGVNFRVVEDRRRSLVVVTEWQSRSRFCFLRLFNSVSVQLRVGENLFNACVLCEVNCRLTFRDNNNNNIININISSYLIIYKLINSKEYKEDYT